MLLPLPAYSAGMSSFWARHKTTLVAFAAASVALAVLFVLWTPVCLWTTGSVSECRRMTS